MTSESRIHTLTIVLIGTKGCGKSSTGNSILGENRFKVFIGTKDGTQLIQKEENEISDAYIVVVDTPGMRDISDFNINMTKLHIPENEVYAIVISIGRYTTQDKKLLTEIETTYKYILKKSFVIFTRGKELSAFDDEQAIDKWLEDTPSLSDFIKRHQLQFRVFENVHSDLAFKRTQAKGVIDLCKALVYNPACIGKDTQKRTITVEYDAMKKTFGEKGVEYFEEISRSESQIS